MLYFYNVTVCVYADVAELVDALDLGSSGFIRECSSHFIRTSAPHSGERFSFAALNRQGNVFFRTSCCGKRKVSQHGFPQPGGKLL